MLRDRQFRRNSNAEAYESYDQVSNNISRRRAEGDRGKGPRKKNQECIQ